MNYLWTDHHDLVLEHNIYFPRTKSISSHPREVWKWTPSQRCLLSKSAEPFEHRRLWRTLTVNGLYDSNPAPDSTVTSLAGGDGLRAWKRLLGTSSSHHWHPAPLPGGHASPLRWSGWGRKIRNVRAVPSQKESSLGIVMREERRRFEYSVYSEGVRLDQQLLISAPFNSSRKRNAQRLAL